jgi:membrane protein required for colicin V production
MNWIDIVIAIPILWMAYRGFGKGFIVEASTLVGLIIGVYAAVNFSWVIKSAFYKIGVYGEFIPIIALAVTFVIAVMLVVWLGRAIEKLFDALALTFLDKGVGAVFGMFKAAVLISVVLFVFNQSGLEDGIFPEEKRNSSLIYEPVASIIPTILDYVNLEDFHVDGDKIKKDLGVDV